MPHPKIQPAIDEIQAVLARHDLAGVVFVASPTHTQFLLQLDPSWSVIRTEGDNGIRFRALAADYPSKEAHQHAIEVSTGLLMGFSEAMRRTGAMLDQIVVSLGRKFEISHTSRFEGKP
jgi:hypothetical protein